MEQLLQQGTLILGSAGLISAAFAAIYYGVKIIGEGYGDGEPQKLGFGVFLILLGLFILLYLAVQAGWIWPSRSTL